MSLTTRGQVRWLAHAALLSPAPARPRGRTDWRATAELLAAGLIAPAENGYLLAGLAAEWTAMPRDVLAQLAHVASIDAARAILGVFGMSAIFVENGRDPPGNGANANKSGARLNKNDSTSVRNAVVVAFPAFSKSENNNNSCALAIDELQSIGVVAVTARKLARRYPGERIREVVAAAAQAANPPAWAYSALVGNWVVERRPKPAAAPRPAPRSSAAQPQLWPAWAQISDSLRAKVQPHEQAQLEAVHAVLCESQLQLLCANRMAAAQLAATLPAIVREVAKVDPNLVVQVAIGSAYAAA